MVRDLGLLPIDSVARRVDREMFVLLGGNTALLLQIAHPLVAAGVADHSDFRRRPIERLRRTLDLTLAIVFGDRATAERAIQRIDHRHATVVGRTADGRTYDARDPLLMLWVQCTLVLTSLRFYELVLGPLTPEEREAYWQEAKIPAAALGVPASLLPRTLADLERYEREALAAAVAPDATAREVARAVLRPFAWVPDLVYWPGDVLAAALLPARLRAAFGLRWGTRERLLFHGILVATRGARRLLPEWLTVVPQARRFEAARRS